MLPLFIIIQLYFFNLAFVPLDAIEDVLKLINWLLLFTAVFFVKKKITKFDLFFKLIGLSLVLNFVSSSYFRNQDFLVSLKTALFICQIYFFYVLIMFKPSIQYVERLIIIFSVVLCGFFMLQRIVYPIMIFDTNIGVSQASDTNVVRWTFTGQGFLSLGVLCCLNRYFESKNLKYLYFTILLLGYFLLQGSRSLLFAIVVAIIYFMYKKGLFKLSVKNLFKFVIIVFGFFALSYVPVVNNVLNYSVERTLADSEKDSDYVRLVQLNYFTNDHFKSPIEYFFGSGFPGDSKYGHAMADQADALTNLDPINWVDLGFLGLSFIAGIPFTVVFLFLLVREGFRKEYSPNSYYIQCWYIFLIAATITYPTAFNSGNMIIVALSLYILENDKKVKIFNK